MILGIPVYADTFYINLVAAGTAPIELSHAAGK
jgi:hypothetical protein